MKSIFFLFIIFSCVLLSCEDTKKTNSTDAKNSASEEIPTIKIDSISKINIEKPEFPKITKENVVSFLTEYGQKNQETKVKISTNHGEIEIELFRDTPLHRANFIYLVKNGYFSETFFHRIVPNFIIQGGNADRVEVPRGRSKIGDYLLPAELKHTHTYGTISGAKEYRENPDKQTMPFEFFIFLGPKTSTAHLDGNYTVFGKVTKGMEIVEKIANLPADDGEWPRKNVYITAEVLQ